jgi:transposase
VDMHGSDGATALLGLDGFVAGAQVEEGGEVWIVVETRQDVTGCPVCGTRAVGNGRRVVKVCDLPAGDRPVVLVWRKRIWRCPAPECEVKCFSEETDAIAPRTCLTERARAEICRRVGKEGHSVAAVARDLGVS